MGTNAVEKAISCRNRSSSGRSTCSPSTTNNPARRPQGFQEILQFFIRNEKDETSAAKLPTASYNDRVTTPQQTKHSENSVRSTAVVDKSAEKKMSVNTLRKAFEATKPDPVAVEAKNTHVKTTTLKCANRPSDPEVIKKQQQAQQQPSAKDIATALASLTGKSSVCVKIRRVPSTSSMSSSSQQPSRTSSFSRTYPAVPHHMRHTKRRQERSLYGPIGHSASGAGSKTVSFLIRPSTVARLTEKYNSLDCDAQTVKPTHLTATTVTPRENVVIVHKKPPQTSNDYNATPTSVRLKSLSLGSTSSSDDPTRKTLYTERFPINKNATLTLHAIETNDSEPVPTKSVSMPILSSSAKKPAVEKQPIEPSQEKPQWTPNVSFLWRGGTPRKESPNQTALKPEVCQKPVIQPPSQTDTSDDTTYVYDDVVGPFTSDKYADGTSHAYISLDEESLSGRNRCSSTFSQYTSDRSGTLKSRMSDHTYSELIDNYDEAKLPEGYSQRLADSTMAEEPIYEAASELGLGDHRVLSYSTAQSVPRPPILPSPTSSVSSSDKDWTMVTNDEWEDMSEIEDSVRPYLRVKVQRTRSRARKVTCRRSWSQVMRDARAKQEIRERLTGQHNQYCSLQGEFDSDEVESNYEVIKPRSIAILGRDGNVINFDDDSFESDDSFDDCFSDVASEESNPLYQKQRNAQAINYSMAPLSLLPPRPVHDDERNGVVNGASIGRLAEAAGKKMQQLSRKISLSSADIRQEMLKSFSRIHRKSVSSGDAVAPSPTSSKPASRSLSSKSWSFKRRFNKSSASNSKLSKTHDRSTFYLSVDVFEPDDSAMETASMYSSCSAPEWSVAVSSRNKPSAVGSTPTNGSAADGSHVQRPVSQSVGPRTGKMMLRSASRPTLPPPDPPKKVSNREGARRSVPCEATVVAPTAKYQRSLSAGEVLRQQQSNQSDGNNVNYASSRQSNGTRYAQISMNQLAEEKAQEPPPLPERNLAKTPMKYNQDDRNIGYEDVGTSPSSVTNGQSHNLSLISRLSPVNGSKCNDSMEGSVLSSDSSNSFGNDEQDFYVSTIFAQEPLYQFYNEDAVQRAEQEQEMSSSSEEGYEEVDLLLSSLDSDTNGNIRRQLSVATGSSVHRLLVPNSQGHRTLWCELPEVVSSGILERITSNESKLQEAMFEIITSEASYLHSLRVLEMHFAMSASFVKDRVLSRREWKVLFEDVKGVRQCSERFLAALEKRWKENIYLTHISDIVEEHAHAHCSTYVKYCANQVHRERLLRRLKETNSSFVEALNRLESQPVCQEQALYSFLMLPMQRVTRMPLLMDAVFTRLTPTSAEHQPCKLACFAVSKVVRECNEGARRMERMEELLLLSQQLDFREVRSLALVCGGRYLVRKGEAVRLHWKDNDSGRLTFGRRVSQQRIHLFLFSDLLVIARKKGDDSYLVMDHCPRNMIDMKVEGMERFPLNKSNTTFKNLLRLTLLENHDNKTVEMILSCPTESDRTRWVAAVTPRHSDDPSEKTYEEWDCPQVRATHAYRARQPDEINLQVTDVINVLKKLDDGWFLGERLRDGERGWFPSTYCTEIVSAHVRARNLRQRFRLLQLSSSYLSSNNTQYSTKR